MKPRPIENIGLERIVDELGLQEFGTVHKLPERMPWPPQRKGRLRLPRLPTKFFALADPFAIYVCSEVGDQVGRDGTIDMGIHVPHGDTPENGFLFQRFLLWLEGERLQTFAVEMASHSSGRDAELEWMIDEVPHGAAGLIHVLSLDGAAC